MEVALRVVGGELEVRDVRDAGGLETVPELDGLVPGRDALSVVLVVREGVEEWGDLAGGMWQVRSVDEGEVVGWQEVGRYGVCDVAGGEQGMDRYGLDGAGREGDGLVAGFDTEGVVVDALEAFGLGPVLGARASGGGSDHDVAYREFWDWPAGTVPVNLDTWCMRWRRVCARRCRAKTIELGLAGIAMAWDMSRAR